MALISLQEISLAFGGPRLFDQLSVQVEPGERIALLGRNGTGKTTLMKILAGDIGVDEGLRIVQTGVKIAHLPQEVPTGMSGTIFDVVLSGLGAHAQILQEYHHISHQLASEHTPELLRRLDTLHTAVDRINGWDLNNQVETILSQMKLDADSEFTTLSGGQKRRVLLAKALVLKPDVLLLDEPTNHLDIASIDALEEFLKKYTGTVFFVTHDRMFMTHLATRILELDRGKLFSWTCSYETFLERKKLALDIEEAQRATFNKKLAEEEIWIRKGVQARRTRNEGRVRALQRLREEKKEQRSVIGQARITAQNADQSGHLVIKVDHLTYGYTEGTPLVKDFSTKIMRGDKIGIIGPNGSGKTTFLRLLLRELTPHTGKVKLGTNLEIAYYDQLREELDGEKTIIENICGQGDTVTVNGRARHIIGYLQDFLFSPDRARTPVKVLSGGERNRLCLARLFTRPFNFLVMDEPTNDLDVETLELLEEVLMEFDGTLLLVSHDRAFLNNVVTSTMVLEGGGSIHDYAGGYDDWLAQRAGAIAGIAATTAAEITKKAADPTEKKTPHPRAEQKLSYNDARELAALPAKIEQLEAEQDTVYDLLADPTFYQRPPQEIAATKTRCTFIEDELLEAYTRWEYLEGIKKNNATPRK